MKDETVIKVRHLSKKYCKELRHTMLYGIQDIARNAIGLSSDSGRIRNGEFWALDDVSFEVKRGETLGIIGVNGSGKTTLLKLLNGILMPDKGRIEIRGRVGALIEIGAGFHPMLTGRENIYVNGTILGMNKKEIDKKFDEIVDFSGIEAFIDTPVKHYSSGMYVRLGFAVAVHSHPDILLVDEVLAVGDESFQAKCFRKIALLKELGTTILFVSHSSWIVVSLCEKGLFLDNGMIKKNGSAKEVTDHYLKFIHNLKGDNALSKKINGPRHEETDVNLHKTSLDKKVNIISFGIKNKVATSLYEFNQGEDIIFYCKVKVNEDIKNVFFGFMIRTIDGINCYNTNTLISNKVLGDCKKGDCILVENKIPLRLAPNNYTLSFDCQSKKGDKMEQLDIIYDGVIFRISKRGLFSDGGIADLKAVQELTLLN